MSSATRRQPEMLFTPGLSETLSARVLGTSG
ncbi:MAG: hypothetical protein ACJA2W_002901, partial [Planctomycetota bacterium]